MDTGFLLFISEQIVSADSLATLLTQEGTPLQNGHVAVHCCPVDAQLNANGRALATFTGPKFEQKG